MGNLINIITGFFDVIKSVVDFVIGFFEDIVFIVKSLAQAVINIPRYLSFLPPAVLAIFITGITVVVVYKVVGRD